MLQPSVESGKICTLGETTGRIRSQIVRHSFFHLSLQIIWHVLETYSKQYDLFLYIDSDAVISNHSIEISGFLSNVSFVSPSKCKSFNIDACHIVFGHDPWKRTPSFTVPNSGLFLFRPTLQLRQLVQLWWYLNMHESNFYGFYEQDSLWNLLEDVPSPAAPPPSPLEVILNVQHSLITLVY